MARGARRESQTGYYHVMIRGNNKEMVFSKAVDKQYFIEQLQQKKDEGLISIAAYCLMDNHAHLLINANLKFMSESLKWVNGKYAERYNFKYDRVGHVFQGRYRSEVINMDDHLLRVMRYIHNNPVKAKMVSNASKYFWSSYKCYIGYDDKLLSSNEKQMVMELFSGSMEQFEKYHLQLVEENYEFLELKQVLELEREEKAQLIIERYCRQYGINDMKELFGRKDILEEIIIELIKKSKLSHRRIGELTNTSRGIVHNIAKKA